MIVEYLKEGGASELLSVRSVGMGGTGSETSKGNSHRLVSVNVRATVEEYAEFAKTYNFPPVNALRRAITEGDFAVRVFLDDFYKGHNPNPMQEAYKIKGFQFFEAGEFSPSGVRFDFANGESMVVYDTSNAKFADKLDYFSDVRFQFTKRAFDSVGFLKSYPATEETIVEYSVLNLRQWTDPLDKPTGLVAVLNDLVRKLTGSEMCENIEV